MPLDDDSETFDDADELDDAPSWYGETLECDSSEASAPIDRLRVALNSSDSPGPDSILTRGQIGSYRPIELIGRGGMGSVYRAENADGKPIALKVLRQDINGSKLALQRFRKEATLLGESASPAITKLYEIGEDDGLSFLAMELVDGISLHQLMKDHCPLPERVTLMIIAEILRGLATLHEKATVHRDLKPANILLVQSLATEIGAFDSQTLSPSNSNADAVVKAPISKLVIAAGTVKLTDFGLARHVDQPESLELTKTNAVLGTPQYMAPEQFAAGHDIDPTVDIYALGATLFEMLSGRHALPADSFIEVATQHRQTRPPLISSLNPAVSDITSQLVAKALEKNPVDRYADASEMLHDVQQILQGRPTQIVSHPHVPSTQPNEFDANIRTYELVCHLKSSPEVLWPYVSNTERINRAVDLPAVNFHVQTGEHGDVQHYGSTRFLGMNMSWREHPFEWIEASRMSVLRQLDNGPLDWLISDVQLQRGDQGGTILTHRFQVRPRGLMGRLVARLQVGWHSRRAFDRAYHHIDDVLTWEANQDDRESQTPTDTRSTSLARDAFESPNQLTAAQRRKLDGLIRELRNRNLHPDVLLRLEDHVARGAAQSVARLQPFALAKQWGLPQENVIAAFLHAAHVGLLDHCWDIHCPICRVPSARVDELREVKTHGRCDVCNEDFAADLVHSVELTFRVHPSIREVDQQTYCIGGPWHLPHVVAQARLDVGEVFPLSLRLDEGDYQIRSPQLSDALPLSVSSQSRQKFHRLDLSQEFKDHPPLVFSGTGQRLTLHNQFPCELLIRVERMAQHRVLLNAAKIASHPLFRELFPNEVLATDIPVSIPKITFVVNELKREADFDRDALPNDADRYGGVQTYLAAFRTRIASGGGFCFKVVGDQAIAVFYDHTQAERTAASLGEISPPGFSNQVRIQQGPAVMATVNDQLEYFGETLNEALR
ncbi:protein kinase domain-containing protein [Planctomycetes bacterium K23_9]|uniref:Serine/threonine-protein kinase StkP n=1 Tax=Stieleria marina TaxID=1930275 RepID=A0A517NVS0_9BACT|nr:Serine/threonine-protein kinase StkP [Planctomycetes bacterium K23_9]